MASDNTDPPDKLAQKYYTCHKKKLVKTVICVICENVYCKIDFEKLNNTKYVGEHLVICPNHILKDITTKSKEKHVLGDVAKCIIAQIKLKKSEEIREEILQDLHNKTVEKLNNTVKDDESDVEILITENMLLKQLVNELQDKNQLQKEIIDFHKNKNTENLVTKKTYAEAISDLKPKPKRVPKIIIKNRDPKQKNTVELITNYLVSDKSIQTKFIRPKNENEIEISCMNSESVEILGTMLPQKLKNCDVKIEQKNNPKIKIIGIVNATNMDEESMEEDINNRNFKQFNNSGKILHMYINKRNKTSTVLMEVTPDIYKYIRQNKDKIFIGHQCCKVYDLINITPCFNCGRFGHNGAKCKNETVCIKCTEKHKGSECKNNKVECANCTYNNTNYRTSLPTDHLPTDRIKCTILKNKIKKYINSIDYPITPILPTWDETSALKIIQNLLSNSLLYQKKTKPGVKSLADKLSAAPPPVQKYSSKHHPSTTTVTSRNNGSAE